MTDVLANPQTPSAPALDRGPNRLAWCGWQLDLPENWRPLKIEGSFEKGKMFIGDGASPYFMIRWWRPLQAGEKTFEIDAWMTYRFKKLHASPQPDAPSPRGFSHTAWIRDLQTKEENSRTFWYGYAPEAEAVIELLMTSLTPEEIRNQIIDDILPTLTMAGNSDPIPWSLFSTRFLSPPGFTLTDKHLFSGDVALRLKRGDETLLLRTVYPAELAVSRRSLTEWIDNPPFQERRKNRSVTTRDWKTDRRPLKGKMKTCWKRLPIPLGWVRPQFSSAVAAVDPECNQLLIAEYRKPEPHDIDIAEQAIRDMNREGGQ